MEAQNKTYENMSNKTSVRTKNKKKNPPLKKSPSARLDSIVVEQGLAPSIEKAKAFIMAGEILVDDQVAYKADIKITPENDIRIKEKYPFVSRGASKIEKAFREFHIDVKGLHALDVGISTGGFTDYMLQKGVLSVTGVDVNIRQVDQKIRDHPKVTLIETNARYLEKNQIPLEPDIITIDVSFISISRILPALTVFKNARIISLVKPQFEVRKENVEKGGIIREKEKRIEILLELKEKAQQMNYAVTGFTRAGIKGRKGNQEYFFLLEYGKKDSINDTIITDET